MSMVEGLRAGLAPTGVVINAESGIQLYRIVDLCVRSDARGTAISSYKEIEDALLYLPPFCLETQVNGERHVVLRTRETIDKFEICGAEAHVVLKLGGVALLSRRGKSSRTCQVARSAFWPVVLPSAAFTRAIATELIRLAPGSCLALRWLAPVR